MAYSFATIIWYHFLSGRKIIMTDKYNDWKLETDFMSETFIL